MKNGGTEPEGKVPEAVHLVRRAVLFVRYTPFFKFPYKGRLRTAIACDANPSNSAKLPALSFTEIKPSLET